MAKPTMVFHINGFVQDAFIESMRDKILDQVNDEYHIVITGNHLKFETLIPADDKPAQKAVEQA